MGKIDNSNTQCCVPQCKSRLINEITLFRFPKEESQRKKWTDAIKIEKGITQNMQVCSRHFVKNDYIISDDGSSKVKRLKRTAVPSQNLPWQFPNKRVSPTLAKARLERLKNRLQLKTSDSPDKSESPAKKTSDVQKSEASKKAEDKISEASKKAEDKISEASKKTEDKITEASKKLEGDKKSQVKRSDSSSVKSEDVEGKSEMSETDEKDVEKATEDSSVDVKDENDDGIEENDEAVEENGDEAAEDTKDADNMTGAPTRLRQRKGVIKCEHCGRKCLTPLALQTHQQTAHKNAKNNLFNPKREPMVSSKPKSPKPHVPHITVKSPESLQQPRLKPFERSLNTREVEKLLQEDIDFVGTASESSESSVKDGGFKKQGQRKAEFECPICKRRFAVFFMANKHIQKYHSGPQTPLLPKPNRVEICTSCNITLDSKVHNCSGPYKLVNGYICSGCEQEYKTLTLFDMHKTSRHNDGVESMFFPTLDEFQVWKQRMETQTRAKYNIMDHTEMKKIHRCTHRTVIGTGNNSKQRMCPSSIVVQEFTKGFQVHYYPNHYDHTYEKYNLGKAFKKYSISTLMNQTASKMPDSDDDEQNEDLYVQFKKITDVLVNEAARINVNGLKQLMRKALDMIAIVNSYVEDEDEDMITSSVIKLDPDKDDLQDEVKKALQSLKRPSESIEDTPAKRRKSVFQSTENLESKEVVRFTDDVKNEETVNKFEKKVTKLTQSPSFIDTFQDFVGKSLVKPVEKRKRIPDVKKPPTVKTKMGQFKPKSPTTNASPKSPKTISPRKSGVKEIEYEVKEQENDCNILILKI